MSIKNIEAIYPVGRLDKGLLVVGGNKRMYEFVGEYIYSPLYKLVLEKDVDRLKNAVSLCDLQPEDVEECVHFINGRGGYDTYLVILRRAGNFDGYEIELQNVSENIGQIEKISSRLGMLRDYLTVSGSALFSYRPADGWFKLFWMDYEQEVEICDMPFEQWREQIVGNKQVSEKDREVFDSFCEAVKSGNQEQVYIFRGNILNGGKSEETYRVKIQSRMYGCQKRVLGVWSVIRKRAGNTTDVYTEGNHLDSMTKMLNRKGIMEYAEAKVAKGADAAVIMLDIDNFKNVNDTFGHPFGDAVITAVADVIKKVVGNSGVAGRVGGDEFMVILNNCGDELTLRNHLRGIKMNVAALFPDKVGNNRITCSIGVSRNNVDSDNFKELYRIADKALYLAKEKGKNRYIIYKPELHGVLRISEANEDLTDIKEAFYSERDLNTFNRSLADLVLQGSGELPEVLEQMAHVLTVSRVQVFWGEERQSVAAWPLTLMENPCDAFCYEKEEYRELFQNDMLQIGNVNKLEYIMPEIYGMYRENKVCSILQHYLRDGKGEIRGFVTVEECSQIRDFPKLAMQIFESMCKVLNAVLLREEANANKSS